MMLITDFDQFLQREEPSKFDSKYSHGSVAKLILSCTYQFRWSYTVSHSTC